MKKTFLIIFILILTHNLFSLSLAPDKLKFTKYNKNPILLRRGYTWESKCVYNPAVITNNGNFYIFYRGQDWRNRRYGWPQWATSYGVSSIGLAISTDGMNITTRYTNPVISPNDGSYDEMGCEDPRIVKINNRFYITYNGLSSSSPNVKICLASSEDLINWIKHGEISGTGLFNNKKNGAILPYKINGRYWMYFGDGDLYLASTTNEPPAVAGQPWSGWQIENSGNPVMTRRNNYFDSDVIRPGPPPFIWNGDIGLIYNGTTCDSALASHPRYKNCKITEIGWVIFSNSNPAKIKSRCDKPFVKVTEFYEQIGNVYNTVYATGFVDFNTNFYLYFGGSDCYIGMGVGAPPAPALPRPYYVNDTDTTGDVWCSAIGNDSNDGLSPSTPVRNIKTIFERYSMCTGSTLYIDKGSYSDGNLLIEDITNSSGYFVIRGTGNSETDTVIDGGGAAAGVNNIFNLKNCRNIKIINLHIKAASQNIILLENCSNAIISNCWLKQSDNNGIALLNSKGNSIIANKIGDNNDPNYIGIFLTNSRNNLISKNKIWKNRIDGIKLINSYNNQIEFNNVYENTRNGIYLKNAKYNRIYRNICAYNQDNGFKFEASTNIAVINNTSFKNKVRGFLFESNSTSCTLRNNIAQSNCLTTSDYGIQIITGSSLAQHRYNNSFANGSSLANNYNYTPDVTEISVDSLFISFTPSSSSFMYLSTNSPCIEAGDESDPVPPNGGSIVDIGAVECTNLTPPPPPHFLSVDAISTNEIDLRWSNVPRETSYTLFRSTSNNTNTAIKIAGIPRNITNYNDTSLVSGTTYYYWLKAYNSAGKSQFSSVGSNTTTVFYPTSLYINDNSTSGDVWCTAIGNDSNDGLTPATPKATISNALSSYVIKGGCTIYIDKGVYLEQINLTSTQNDNGGPTNYLVFVGAGTNDPASGTGTKIDGGGIRTYCFNIQNKKMIKIMNMRINASTGGANIYLSSSTNIIITNCKIYQALGNGDGIKIDNNSKNIKIVNSVIGDGLDPNKKSGVEIVNNSQSNLIIGNIIYDNNNGQNLDTGGITIKAGAPFNKIIGNQLYGNRGGNIIIRNARGTFVSNNITRNAYSGWGEEVGIGCWYATNTLIIANVISNNPRHGIKITDYSIKNNIKYNRIKNNGYNGIQINIQSKSNNITHNFVYHNGYSGGTDQEKCNIFIGNGSDDCRLYRNISSEANYDGLRTQDTGSGNVYRTHVINNTFFKNGGRGVLFDANSKNCMLTNNIAESNNNEGFLCVTAGGATMAGNNYNNSYGNASGNYVNITPSANDTQTSSLFQSTNPSSANYLYISPTSPCKDAGDPSYPNSPCDGSVIDKGAIEIKSDGTKCEISFLRLIENEFFFANRYNKNVLTLTTQLSISLRIS